MKHQAAIAALVIAALGLATLPAAAQDNATPTTQRVDRDGHRMIFRDGGPRMGRGATALVGFVCSPRGAEAVDVAFVRLSHRIELTGEQQPLFDALREKALTTQTSFADTCEAAMPDRTADEKPDLIEGMKARIKVDEARLAALNAVMPDLEAFYDSLTEEQKASLMPHRGMRDHRMSDRDHRPDAPGRTTRLPAPGR